jgi:tRNA nucleotidyltransferase (CCA-adding enzyme)
LRHEITMPDYNFLLTTRLSQDQQMTLEALQRVCRDAGLNLYLTGGSMRDLLTGNPVRVLHFTTEGDPVGLAAALRTAGAERLSVLAEQRTLSCSLRGCRLRLAAARAESGGAATIVEDLRRRGLTLNSIGLSLNAGSRGLPLDPANGAADIEARLIRMNHSYVFLEDPMTLVRAVRLATRLDFAIEERTLARMESAREGNYLARASAASKGQELEAIAYDPDPGAVLRALDKDQWLPAAFGAGVRAAKMDLHALARLAPAIEGWEQLGLTLDAGLVAMPFILGGLAAADQSRLAEALPSHHLAHDWKKVRTDALAIEKRLLAISGPGAWLHRVQEIVEKATPEAVVYATVAPSNPKAGKKLKDFQVGALQLRQRLPLGILRSFDLAPHSLQAEEILRPWYRRLLSGEALADAALAEGVRQAVLKLRPQPAPPPLPEPSQPRRGRRGRPAASAPVVTPAPVALPAPVAPAARTPPAAAKLSKPTRPAPARSAPARSKSRPRASAKPARTSTKPAARRPRTRAATKAAKRRR